MFVCLNDLNLDEFSARYLVFYIEQESTVTLLPNSEPSQISAVCSCIVNDSLVMNLARILYKSITHVIVWDAFEKLREPLLLQDYIIKDESSREQRLRS